MTVTVQCSRCGTSVSLDSDVSASSALCSKCFEPLAPRAEQAQVPGSSANRGTADDTGDVIPAYGKGAARTGSESAARAGSGSNRIPSTDPEAGHLPRRVDNYELLEVLGRGGMGVVYKARHVALDRMVALKLIRGKHPHREDTVRFVHEAQVTGQIEHPNIVPVHEIGADPEGRPYFVMKLVHGRSLSQVLFDLRKGDLDTMREFTLERLLEIFIEICQAVAFAHSRGVLHRDLKPSNVMVGEYGEVLLMDWGLAKRFADAKQRPGMPKLENVHTVGGTLPESKPGVVAGTPEYMSPEQAMGDTEALSPRSDVYSLGAMLFEILTYRPPHIDKDTHALLHKVVSKTPEFPRKGGFRRAIPKRLRAICLKALALKPEQRYMSAVLLYHDVRAYLEDRPLYAKRDTLFDKFARVLRRHGKIIGVLSAALILLSSGTAIALYFVNQSARQAEESTRKEKDASETALAEARERAKAVSDRNDAMHNAEAAWKAQQAESNQRVAEANRLKAMVPEYVDALDLLKRHQYQAAIRKLDNVIATDPHSPVAALAFADKGDACEHLGTPEGAQQAIAAYRSANEAALRANQIGDPRALLRCADLSWRYLNDPQKAHEYYEQASHAHPGNPYSQLGTAYLELMRGREEKDPAQVNAAARKALAQALDALHSGEWLWEAHYVVGALYGGLELPASGLRNLPLAQKHLLAARDLESSNAFLQEQYGRVEEQLGEHADALSAFESALRLNPEFTQALAGRARMLMKLGRTDDALPDLQALAQVERPAPEIKVLLALAWLEKGKFAEASELLNAVILQGGASAEVFLARARARAKLGIFSEAADDAAKALPGLAKGTPEYLTALQLRAECALRSGQAAQAAEGFKALLDQYPAQSEAWKGLGDALRAANKLRDALDAYRAFLKQEPDQYDLRAFLVRMLLEELQDPKEALDEARAGEVRAAGKNAKLLLALADALWANKRYDEAWDVIERQAYARFPGEAEVQAARKKYQGLMKTVPAKPK